MCVAGFHMPIPMCACASLLTNDCLDHFPFRHEIGSSLDAYM
jgi:hypothetical protein